MKQIKEKIGNRKGKEKRDDFECVTTFYSFFLVVFTCYKDRLHAAQYQLIIELLVYPSKLIWIMI